MKLYSRIILISMFALAITAAISVARFSSQNPTLLRYPAPVAEKIILTGFSNLYKVSDSIYRSEQPESAEMKTLENFGIKTVLNLRNYHSDNDEALGTSLILERIPMRAGKIDEQDIVQTMKILMHSKKPLLIHCLHGSDRTGCMVAAYRIIFQNWSKDEAINELRNPVFGYHESWFPNIVKTLQSLNVPEIRSQMGVSLK